MTPHTITKFLRWRQQAFSTLRVRFDPMGERTTEPIAVALRRLLDEREMSVFTLALRADVSTAVIYAYLSRRRGAPGTIVNKESAETMRRLALALSLPPDYFIEIRRYRMRRINDQFPGMVDAYYDDAVAQAKERGYEDGLD
jgi:transcriptional regulator with XRE-family HTH domain